jgi:hypothetical protein
MGKAPRDVARPGLADRADIAAYSAMPIPPAGERAAIGRVDKVQIIERIDTRN